MADARREIEKLREQIRYHDRKYYIEAAPEISDKQYDELLDALKKLEAAHPELITPDSPHAARGRAAGRQPAARGAPGADVVDRQHLQHRGIAAVRGAHC